MWASLWTPRVDPETLTHSQAALAKALVRQGLVAEAIRGGGDGLPLLRGITAQTLAGVAGEEQVIVFAERVWCLRQLAHTLTERHGVEAHVADGQIKPHEFEALKHRFTSGEFPVLCLSRIGAEGHNLQNASVIVHLDLPWLPSGLEQRVGRAARPGRRARLGADLHPLHPRRGRRAHRLDPLPPRRRAPRRARLIRGRRRQPIHHRHPARRRSPARSPTPSKTPATPPPPPASASPPACSAPNRDRPREPDRTGESVRPAPIRNRKEVAHERDRRSPVHHRPGRERGRPRPRTPH